MILTALYELYDRLVNDPSYELPRPGWSYQNIGFVVVLTPAGKLVSIQDICIQEGKTRRPRRVLVPGGQKKTGSGINPQFLWDNTTYMLGFTSDPKKKNRARRCFDGFKERHRALESEINHPAFSAVCRFLESWDPDNASQYEDVLSKVESYFGVFQIQGETRYVHEIEEIKKWLIEHKELWDQNGQHRHGSSDILTGQCIITGKTNVPIARLHPKIKGVSGAQSSGAGIVNFNLDAFTSYGKEQSYNAPVSEDAVFRYTSALNCLLTGPHKDKHKLVLGTTTITFWTDTPSFFEDIFLQFAREGSEMFSSVPAQDEGKLKKVRIFFNALKKGKHWLRESDFEEDPDQTTYYILAMTPNNARIAVSFFYQNTLGSMLDNLSRHFEDIGLERTWGEGSKHPDPEFPSLQCLLQALLNPRQKLSDLPPHFAPSLLESIITGKRYAEGIYFTALRRILIDKHITYPRLCLIKGYLNRNHKKEVLMSLDPTRKETPYRLGRLFAVLEKTQTDALGNIGSSIRDRYYSSASATPSAVFPRLLRLYQHHLSKLEDPHKIFVEKLVQEILDPVENFPAHLNMTEQGLFALGYYHQKNAFYKKQTPEPQTSISVKEVAHESI